MTKPEKVLAPLPRGYESGYQIVHIDGWSVLSKPGMASMVFTDDGWREVE